MIRMVANPELAPNDGRHTLGGPDVTPKPERLGPLGQQLRQLRPLLGGQLRDRARPRSPLQRLYPTLPHAPHPLADRPGCHAQCLGNRLLTPSFLLQFPRPSATAFTPFLRLCNFLCHTSQQRMTQTTLACSTEISRSLGRHARSAFLTGRDVGANSALRMASSTASPSPVDHFVGERRT